LFADVIGQPHVVQALSNALDSGRIHHAYLFTGTRGVGKTTLARILAKALNCVGADGRGGITSQPCGVCTACTDIDAGRFVDLLEVDAATNTKVDEMRELLETAQYAPVSGRYKVYIIDEVHMLSKSAFNAMLKTLEEPPGHVEFILATTDPQKLPITVLSRCLQFNLKNLPPDLIASHLAHILKVEKIPFDPPALDLIGRAGEGSARDALSLLDQAIAYGAGSVRTEQVSDMLGALDQSWLFTLLDCLADRNAKGLLSEVRNLAERSISYEATLKELAGLLSRIALVQSAGEGVAEGAEADSVVRMAGRFSADELQLFYQIALLGRRDLTLAPDEQTGFSMTMLRMLAFADSGKATSVAVPQAAPRQAAVESSSSAAPVEVSAPRAAEMPRPAAASAPAVVPAEFNGDWPGFIGALNLTGMAGMLAKQCEFKSFAGGVLELAVPDAHKHLAERSYLDKLKAALVPHLGEKLRLNIKVGARADATIAAQEERVQSERDRSARAGIEQDEFIKNLKQDFGAEISPSSIRPVQSLTE